MMNTILRIGSLFVALPALILVSQNVWAIKNLWDINIKGFQGRALPADLMILFSNYTDDDLQDCMVDFSKCVRVHKEMPFCGTLANGTNKNFLSICHLAYENCKAGEQIWQSTDDNRQNCDYPVI